MNSLEPFILPDSSDLFCSILGAPVNLFVNIKGDIKSDSGVFLPVKSACA